MERQPGKPARTLEEKVFVALQRTADHLQQLLVEALKPHGLSPTQYNALRILRGAGADGLPCSEVAARMINHGSDVTRLMGRLERRSLTQRKRQEGDRRVITAHITTKGLALLNGLDETIQSFNRDALGHMGVRQLKQLLDLLERANNVGP